LYCIAFIHLYSATHSMSLSEALPTTAMSLCRILHAEALQATVSEGLAQRPYVAARAGLEPTILRSKGFDSTNTPQCPTGKRGCLHSNILHGDWRYLRKQKDNCKNVVALIYF